MELLILLGLVVLNGVFAMSEMAVVAARKVILQEQARQGRPSAISALKLVEDPDRFLSTVQVGITLIGIIAGAFGGSAIAQDIAGFIRAEVPALAAQADQIGFGLIVLLTTYLSLVIGELVPKRIALSHSESVAMLVAPAMLRLSRWAGPLVSLLSRSTELLAGLLGVRENAGSVSDREIIALVREGVHTGDFDPSEQRMVQGVLELDDIRLRDVMTPRVDLTWLDIHAPVEDTLARIAGQPRSVYPVGDGSVDQIIGVVHAQDLLKQLLDQRPIDLRAALREAVFVPEATMVAHALQHFRDPATKVVMVIDEYGGIAGLVSENDIMLEIMGQVDTDIALPVQRDDGSWLFDGRFSVEDIQHYLPGFSGHEADAADYSTLAGFVLAQMGRMAQSGDQFHWHRFTFEVLDMDGRRIDKVLITPDAPPPAGDASG